MKRTAILILVILIGILAVLFFESKKEGDKGIIFKSEPTNFVKIGVVTFNNPGQKHGVPYLVYEEPGSPALTKELTFDTLSFCSVSNGGIPCVAMSLSYDAAFGGQRVIVDGNTGEEKILVRKIRVLREGEQPLPYDPGNVFIAWSEAMNLIKECKVELVTQTHSADIYLTLKNGDLLRTVEPILDEIFSITQEAMKTCGSIGVATE